MVLHEVQSLGVPSAEPYSEGDFCDGCEWSEEPIEVLAAV
jgi:hypothetical protein